MQWEKMTPKEFSEYIKSGNRICILPIGSMEKHGEHLPLGNDTLKAYQYCLKASEKVRSVVMPPFYFTHVPMAVVQPGAINIPVSELLKHFELICDEIGRNGFSKIVLASAHGGNKTWLPALIKDMAVKDKNYHLFYYRIPLFIRSTVEKLFENQQDIGGHGGAAETAIGLYLFEDAVDKQEMVDQQPIYGNSADFDFGNSDNTYDFVRSYPRFYSGNPSKATRDIGKTLFNEAVDNFADTLRKIAAVDINALNSEKLQFFKKFNNPHLKPEDKNSI